MATLSGRGAPSTQHAPSGTVYVDVSSNISYINGGTANQPSQKAIHNATDFASFGSRTPRATVTGTTAIAFTAHTQVAALTLNTLAVAQSSAAVTWWNSNITTGSIIVGTAGNYAGTAGIPYITSVSAGTGYAIINVSSVSGTTNGAVDLNMLVL